MANCGVPHRTYSAVGVVAPRLDTDRTNIVSARVKGTRVRSLDDYSTQNTQKRAARSGGARRSPRGDGSSRFSSTGSTGRALTQWSNTHTRTLTYRDGARVLVGIKPVSSC